MRDYYYGSLRFNIGDMLGKTFKNVINDNDDRVVFTEENGDQYIFYHIQDCCESVTVRDIVGDLSDLVGSLGSQSSGLNLIGQTGNVLGSLLNDDEVHNR